MTTFQKPLPLARSMLTTSVYHIAPAVIVVGGDFSETTLVADAYPRMLRCA